MTSNWVMRVGNGLSRDVERSGEVLLELLHVRLLAPRIVHTVAKELSEWNSAVVSYRISCEHY
jgi:hypothetical protein